MRPRLCSFEAAWIDAAFDTIYPERGSASAPLSKLPHGIASMHPARFFDELLATVPLEQAVGLRITLWMVALAPLFTIRRLGTIASIAPAERTRVLERLLASPIYVVRQLALSCKALATLLYVQSATIRAAMTEPVTPRDRLVSAARLTRRDETGTGTVKMREQHDHAAQ